MNQELPEVSLVNSVAADNLQDVLADLGEVGLDAVLEAGTLEDVPVLGTLLRLSRATREIRHQLYLRKIQRFLRELSRVSTHERQAFLRRLGDDNAQRDFGEAILLLLERADDMQKPAMIGRIMEACVLGNIPYAQALRLCNVVDRAFFHDLQWLQHFRPGLQGEHVPIAEALHGAGVLSVSGIDGGSADGGGGGFHYELNEYGHLLLQHAFPRRSE